MQPWGEIESRIAATTGRGFRVEARAAARGGCINAAWVIEGAGARFFVKLNAADRADMFEAEANGLRALAKARAIRVPEVVCHGTTADASWIVLEHITLADRGPATDAALGAQLAALHRERGAQFGWERDNTIGATAQPNAFCSDWPTLWAERRLRFQLELATRNGHSGALQREGEKLAERVPMFFSSYRPEPSLLHGDLWSGNAAADPSGAPVVFDPAVYYGDREADLAMTELFGGYAPVFLEAYAEAYPLDPGYEIRRTLYNLYHVLNHLNLFGGGYLAQAERMIAALLAHTR